MKALLSNPRVLVLLMAIVVVSGLAGLQALPRAEDPHIGNRNAVVLTSFPGASAERVEALIAEPLEQKLREIPELDHIESRSSAGFSSISLMLKEEVGQHQTASLWAEVRDKLEEAGKQLPAKASAPLLDDQRAYSYTMVAALSWRPEYKQPEPAGSEADAQEYDHLRVLGRYARELENRLRDIHGTDYIKLHGEPVEEILVSVDAARAAKAGLSVAEIGRQVLAADAKVSAGELHNRYQRMAVELTGALDSTERIRKIPLQASANQTVLQLADVATVSRQPRLPLDKLAIIDGHLAVVIGMRMLPDQRSDVWAANMQQALDAFSAQLPANISLEVIFDQQAYTAHRLGELSGNIVIGFSLILTVLLFTLGWRSALMVALALPLTVLFSFACMQFVGLPIHQMSVTGMIVALGIMVDNAIVMVDTVDRFKHRGYSGLNATFAAACHLWKPLLGSTLTTVLAFMPIVLMGGPSSEFVGGISLTVIFSLIGSYLISHLIIAGIAGRFLQPNKTGGFWQQGVQLPVVSAWFKRSLSAAIQRPATVIVLVTLLPVLGYWGGSRLPEQFFPPADRDMINFEVYLPASASLAETRALTEKITRQLQSEPAIISVQWFIGGNAPSFYYNLMQRRDNTQYYAQAMIKLDHFTSVTQLVPALQHRLDDQFPGAQIIVRRLEQGPPFNAPVELRLTGPDLTVLKNQGEQLRRRILAIDNVVHVRPTLSEAIPKLWWQLDENRARNSGLSLTEAAAQLQGGIDGVVSGSVLEQTQSLPVRVQAENYRRGDIGGIHSWQLVAGSARSQTLPMPLVSLGEPKILPELGVIPRRDGQRINTIEVYIRDGVLPSEVLTAINRDLDANPLSLPDGYHLEAGGENEQRDMAMNKLLASVGPLMMLLIIAVVMSFNSFRLSAVIFVVAALAAGLGMLVLALSGLPFGFTSILGLMGLIGLAINAAIVILAELKSDPAAVTGNQAAVVTAVSNCGRHIVSTTITTVMGFLPLILGGGAFWPPFAMVIAGGTVLTTLLSLYLVPVVFLLMTRHRAFELAEALALNDGPEAGNRAAG